MRGTRSGKYIHELLMAEYTDVSFVDDTFMFYTGIGLRYFPVDSVKNNIVSSVFDKLLEAFPVLVSFERQLPGLKHNGETEPLTKLVVENVIGRTDFILSTTAGGEERHRIFLCSVVWVQ